MFGSVGDSYDNALAETINGLYKAEVIHRKSTWRDAAEVELTTLEWVDWFNNRRLLGPIGDRPQAEVERDYYAAIAQVRMARRQKSRTLAKPGRSSTPLSEQ